ncbi:MAG: PEP-CTERM sorting domain-containing protein [Pirellulaceae bacterium]
MSTAIGLCRPVQADLITNGGFEDPVIPVGSLLHFATGSTIGGAWTVLGNLGNSETVMLLQTTYSEPGNGVIPFNAQEELNSLDLTGSFNQGLQSGVIQAITTSPGETYRVSFYVGRADGNFAYSTASTVDLSINGGTRMPFTNSNSTAGRVNWQLFTTDFVASGAVTTLSFFNGQITNSYTGLDNISVSAIPEPSSLLLVAGFALAVLLRRRNLAA